MRLHGRELTFQPWTVRMIAKIGTFEMHNQRKLLSMAAVSIAAAFLFALGFTIPAGALILDKPGKTGPKLRPHSEGPPCEVPAVLKEIDLSSKDFVYPPICNLVAMRPRENHGMLMGTRNATMKRIADAIASVGDQGRPVVDRTGLRGRFDFTLEWTPDANSPVSSDLGALPVGKTLDLLEGLKEQLGLKLKSTKATILVPAIDHVERPSEN
jgi:uncharacterized protein (TIGR03435 family)